MLDFLYTLLWEIPMDMIWGWNGELDYLGAAMAGIWWLILLMLLGLIVSGIFYLFDVVAVPEKVEIATVKRKKYIPAHTTMVPVNNGKTTTVIPVHHPDRWSMDFVLADGSEVSFDIEEVQFDAMGRGDGVKILVRRGRFSGDKYGMAFATEADVKAEKAALAGIVWGRG